MKLHELVLTTSTSEGFQPGPPTTTFTSDTPVIYAVFETESEKPASVTGVWVAVNVSSGDQKVPPNSEIRRATTAVVGVMRGSITLTRPSQGFPPGDYELRLLLNDKPVQRVPFKVVPGASSGAAPSGTTPVATATPSPSTTQRPPTATPSPQR